MENSEHKLKHFGERLVCTKCLNGFSKSDPLIKHWLQNQCKRNIVQSLDRPTPISRSDTFHIGNRSIHSSHALRQHRGLVYCRRCGCVAGTNRICKLAHQCEPPSKYRLENLDNILQNRLPRGMLTWPSERLGLSLPGH